MASVFGVSCVRGSTAHFSHMRKPATEEPDLWSGDSDRPADVKAHTWQLLRLQSLLIYRTCDCSYQTPISPSVNWACFFQTKSQRQRKTKDNLHVSLTVGSAGPTAGPEVVGVSLPLEAFGFQAEERRSKGKGKGTGTGTGTVKTEAR